ncbi:hypothetical protein JVT61DRAFT_11986 [Boletus reticuloceps]|uniref:Uncharacterized protein n=1 Tax=Boletus reticuloceps TaxID=495285 RepID=A0A8I3A3K7_9AGAM|nr:hypothetical protein JVT61DRAFT_11986 [Boletus reticuloceps]
MNATIKAVRSNDATRLKTYIAQYASPDPHKPGSLNPPIVVTNGRAELGLNHPILARWLCPADQLDRFDKDPGQARKDLTSGVMPMRSEDFPCLFWSGEMPGQDYNADNMLHGLFKSYFLVRVGRHIFLGPSSAFGGDTRTTRSCNAVLHNMSTVQAEHVGYICIQVGSWQCSTVLLTGVLGTLCDLFQKSVGGEGW